VAVLIECGTGKKKHCGKGVLATNMSTKTGYGWINLMLQTRNRMSLTDRIINESEHHHPDNISEL